MNLPQLLAGIDLCGGVPGLVLLIV